MKNKVNVDLFVPAINEYYNLFIPINKSVGEVIKLLNQAINELTDNSFPITNNLSLVHVSNGEVCDTTKIVKANNIRNGSRLALI